MSQPLNSQSSAASPPRSQSKRIILILLVLGGGLSLLCCGGAAVLFWTGYRLVQPPINAALAAINSGPLISDKLGSPIRSTSNLGIERYVNNNGNGGVELRMRVQGTKGSADVTGHMDLKDSQWSVGNLLMTCDDGTRFLSNGQQFVLVENQ
jgi:hypothetical protein